jgi:2'-hydroxyisoflavone reductase
MRLLVLGGSSFVGRAAAQDGVRRGWDVTTFNRGRAPDPDGVEPLRGDRLVAADLRPLAARRWDVVFDTWSGAPAAARDSATVLAPVAERYVYVSSSSVYAPPPPRQGDEASATVEASPDADGGDYAAGKRGAELAVQAAFGERALLARAGLILGPHEDVGRLPWWLLRVHRGGEILAPGPPELGIQLIDARDLAAWALDAALTGLGGPFNVVRRAGEETMGSLLDACVRAAGAPDAALTWVDPATVLAAGIEPWSELPVWLPADHEYRGLHDVGVERAYAAGLRPRPLDETVRDTWRWLESIGLRAPQREDRERPGLDPAREAAALAAWHGGRGSSGRP